MPTQPDVLRELCRSAGICDQDSAPMIARYLDVGPLTAEDHEQLAALNPIERGGKLDLRYGSDASRLAQLVYAAEVAG